MRTNKSNKEDDINDKEKKGKKDMHEDWNVEDQDEYAKQVALNAIMKTNIQFNKLINPHKYQLRITITKTKRQMH